MTQPKRADRPIGRVDLHGLGESEAALSSSSKQTRLGPPKAKKPYLCQMSIGGELLEAIGNAVASARSGGDFSYGNTSDFIRAALTDYKNGIRLLEDDLPADRRLVRRTTIWLDKGLYGFWTKLPPRSRREILGRVLWTKLQRM